MKSHLKRAYKNLALILIVVFLFNAMPITASELNVDEPETVAATQVAETSLDNSVIPEDVIEIPHKVESEPAVDASLPNVNEQVGETLESPSIEVEPIESVAPVPDVEPIEDIETETPVMENDENVSETPAKDENGASKQDKEEGDAASIELETNNEVQSSDIGLFAIGSPGEYEIDTSAIALDVILQGTSINDHTVPVKLWVGKEGGTKYVYLAVKSTHDIQYITLQGKTVNRTDTTNFHEYNPWVSIIIDGVEYQPDDLNGSTNKSHWTVVRYSFDIIDLEDDLQYDFFIKGIGGGHDVGGTFIVNPPKVEAKVTKSWVGGSTVEAYAKVQLYRKSVNMVERQPVGNPVELTPATPSYTWSDLPKTDALGYLYTYTISEIESGGGYTPVNPDGEPVAGETFSWKLTNVYKATGNWVPMVSKALNAGGRTLEADEFSFQLKQGDIVLQTKTNAADGSVTFDALNYTQADIGKTYTYTISEVAGSEGGMTYDPMVVTITVTVVDAGGGVLTVTPEYPEDKEFNNTYIAKGSWTPEVTKALDAGGRLLEADEFEFELIDADGDVIDTAKNAADGSVTFAAIGYTQADIGKTYTYTIKEVVGSEGGMTYDPMVVTITVTVVDAGNGILTVTPTYPEDIEFNNSYVATGEWMPEVDKVLAGRTLKDGEFTFELQTGDGELLQTVANDADGKVTFDAIAYDQDDIGKEFTYKILEVIPVEGDDAHEDGMTYDSMVIEIKVMVADAGNGELEVTPTYPEDSVFNNEYAAEGSIVLKVQKILTGRDIKAEEFEFQLRDEEENVLQTMANARDGLVAFDYIQYNQDDIGKTFTYSIVEVAGSENGMTYAENLVTVTVLVEDAGDGELKLTVTYDAEVFNDDELAVFENTYEAVGYFDLEGMKVLEGRDLVEGEFEFELLDADDNILQTVKNDAEGKIVFDTISFDQDSINKKIAFAVREKAGTNGNIVYDATVIEFELEVKDLGNGALEITAVEPFEIEFNNEWQLKDISAKKIWVGAEGEVPVVWFKLQRTVEGEDAVDVPDAEIMKLDGVTEVTWTGLEVFDVDGNEYVYSVVEVDADGEPAVPMYYEKVENGLEVTNTFVIPDPVMIDPQIQKNVVGEGAPPLAGFKFELKAITENAPLPEGSMEGIKVVVKLGAGTAEFGEITFTEPGVYVYEVRELKGDDTRFAYDTTVYVMTVTVTREGNALVAATEFTPQGGETAVEALVFTNKFTAPPPPPGVPKTGETAPLVVLPIILLLAAGVLIIVRRKHEKS